MSRLKYSCCNLLCLFLAFPLLPFRENVEHFADAAGCSTYFPNVKYAEHNRKMMLLSNASAFDVGDGGRRSLRGQVSSTDDLRKAFIEVTSGSEGRGTSLWERMGEYTEVHLNPELKKEVQKTPDSFGTTWRKGVAGELKQFPGTLLPAWCNSVSICHTPSTTEIVTSVRSASTTSTPDGLFPLSN
jgi:hypothetical protein